MYSSALIGNNPLSRNSHSRMGGISWLRVAHSRDILQPNPQSHVLDQLNFLPGCSFRCGWQGHEILDYKFDWQELRSENGLDEPVSLSITLVTGLGESEFRNWYYETLKDRRLSIEITNRNQVTYYLNQFQTTCKYLSSPLINTVELIFERAKLIDLSRQKPINHFTKPFTSQVKCMPYPYRAEVMCDLHSGSTLI